MVGSECDSAERVRQYRERAKSLHSNEGVTNRNVEIECRDERLDLEFNKNAHVSSVPGDDKVEPTGFSGFWEAYPRKVARQDALKAWKALKVDTSLTETIIADVRRRREADWRRLDVRYIPYPASYLRGRRWEDQETTDEGRKGTDGDSYGGDPVILSYEEEAAIDRINADGLNYG